MANTDTTGKDAYGNSKAKAVVTTIEAKGMTLSSDGGMLRHLKTQHTTLLMLRILLVVVMRHLQQRPVQMQQQL